LTKSLPLAAKPAAPWSDFSRRSVSALVLLPVALACLWLGGAVWLLLVAAGAIILLAEWRAMCRTGGLGLIALLAGGLYAALAVASLLWLRQDPPNGRFTVLFLLLVVWGTDIGAYAAGRAIGGPRLAPRVSPGKTWSGAIGGAIAGLLAGLALSLAWPHLKPGTASVFALLVGLASQIGDLLESALKRRCGVKDSGRLIPGHGGLLDRVDGILLAAPVLTLLCLWHAHGAAAWN
jgi:phosphatidate cytidylyltransferase